MYKPKDPAGSSTESLRSAKKLAAIAVSGPFGAVKEQSSGLYAQQLAERGFLTIAFDPSFTGESGGMPRRVASPDINGEDFSAAVDYLMNRDDVDPGNVGILGICGWGGIAIYKTPRGYHVRSGNSNDGWNTTSNFPFMNFKYFEYADELENAVLIVHGDKAHSYYFGKDTFALLKGDNKQMLTVKGASHCDLYDQLDIIPMDEIAAFYTEYLHKYLYVAVTRAD